METIHLMLLLSLPALIVSLLEWQAVEGEIAADLARMERER